MAGVVSPALRGRFTLDQAIARLLSGTDLRYQLTHSGVVLISAPEATPLERWGAALAATLDRLVSGLLPPGGPAPNSPGLQTGATTAQDLARGPSGQLQEVIVTAERRTEQQQNVPMSIVVISPRQLRQSEVTEFNDFAVQVPNLSFDYSGGGNVNDREVAIRGIEGLNTTAFYLDDLPMPISLDPRVIDIERIEVLEGPQGTLYGARSMGGTIRELTAAPSLAQFSGVADVQGTQLDGGSGGYLADLTLNIPIIADTLAVRFTPYRGQDGGWITRRWPVPGYTPGVAPPGQQFTSTYHCLCTSGAQRNVAQSGYEGLNAQVLWKPVANLAIRPKLIYQKLTRNGLPLGNYSAQNTTNYMHFDIPEGTLDRFIFYGGTIDYTIPEGTFTSATSGFDRHTRDYEDVSEFTVFSYGTPMLPSALGFFNSSQHITEELRFTSTWRFPLQFSGGYYYERNAGWGAFNQTINGFAGAVNSLGFAYGVNQVADLWSPTTTWQKAYYGQLIYHITPQWSLTLGERYSWDIYETGGKLWGAIAYPNTSHAASALSLASTEHDHILTPRYVVQYQPNSNLNLYADAAKGFRPGAGQAPPGLNLCSAYYAQDRLTPAQLSQYGPDWVWEYEIGEKAYSDDRRVSINSSLFYINWTNIQELLMFLCGEGATINSGRAVSKGAELDFSAMPYQGFTLNGGIGYDYARITEPGALISVPPAGSPIQEVAPLTANLAGTYQHAFSPNVQWIYHMDWSYTAHRYTVANSPSFPRLIPAHFLVSARFSILRGPAEYALFVRNLGGIHPDLSDQLSNAAEDPGRPRWEEGPPTSYGIEARVTF